MKRERVFLTHTQFRTQSLQNLELLHIILQTLFALKDGIQSETIRTSFLEIDRQKMTKKSAIDYLFEILFSMYLQLIFAFIL